MKSRQFLWLSLSLNVALAGVVWWLATRPRPLHMPPRPVRAAPSLASAQEPAPDPPAPLPTPLATNVPFHWSQVASTDFVRYRDGLRALGCPEQTVREIIESEINASFAQRRRPTIDALQPRFWGMIGQGGKDAFDSFEKVFEALRDERRALLAEVLGERPRDDATELADARDEWSREYAWLPDTQQTQLTTLESERWRQLRALETEIGERPWTAEEQTRRRGIDQRFDEARRQVLGEYLGEFELRHANEGRWAEHLGGFEVTEAEWRAVAEGLREQRAQVKARNTRGDTQAQREAELETEAARAAVLQAKLGPERYAEYERASDAAFQQTRRVTRRLGVSDAAAIEAWGIQRAATAAAATLRVNTAIEEERRRAALAELNAEALRALRQVLGDEGLRAYRRHAGEWLGPLGRGE